MITINSESNIDHLPFEIQARIFESRSQWKEAAYKWHLLGRREDVEACETIMDAIEKGDRYRRLVVNENAHQLLAEQKINIYQYMKILNKVYKEVYG